MSKFGQRVKHLVGEMIPPALFSSSHSNCSPSHRH